MQFRWNRNYFLLLICSILKIFLIVIFFVSWLLQYMLLFLIEDVYVMHQNTAVTTKQGRRKKQRSETECKLRCKQWKISENKLALRVFYEDGHAVNMFVFVWWGTLNVNFSKNRRMRPTNRKFDFTLFLGSYFSQRTHWIYHVLMWEMSNIKTLKNWLVNH